MNYKQIIVFILGAIIGGIWGYFQTTLFPVDKYGFLFLLTAFIGGALIGRFIIGPIVIALEDGD